MARKASKPEAETPESDGQEGHGKITKSEAVRRALAAGADQPPAGVAYVRDNFGIEIGSGHFSAVKSTHLKKQGSITVKVKGRPKAAPAPKQAAAPAVSAGGDADILAGLEAIKPLIAQHGSDKLKRLIDLLG